MADKVAIMNEGVLHQVGDSVEIFESPTSLFVASFIGSPPMNIMDCSLKEKDGRAYIETKDFSLLISDERRDLIKKHTTDTELFLGIRPRDISISMNKNPDSTVRARIYLIESLGSEIIVIFEICDQLINVREKATFEGNIGDTYWISFNKEKIHLFDKKNEMAIK
jgi:multiple sugar transport system ATP-binding protein